MDYNELKGKYNSSAGSAMHEENDADVVTQEPDPLWNPPANSAPPGSMEWPEFGSGNADNSEDGFFGGGAIAGSAEKKRERKPDISGRPGMRLAELPWLDIVFILLTIAGIAYVIVNFDGVTTVIAAVIGTAVKVLIKVLLVAALITGFVLYIKNSRRR